MDPTTFYARKAEILTKLTETLGLAAKDVHELVELEKTAPGCDVDELHHLITTVTAAHHEADGLLDAVKAML